MEDLTLTVSAADSQGVFDKTGYCSASAPPTISISSLVMAS